MESETSEDDERFNYDAPQFFDFGKDKYQRYLRTLEKVLFPNSTTISPLNPNTPMAVIRNDSSSDEREDALWFQRVHSELEGSSPRSPPHPLITPSPHAKKAKRSLGTPRRISSSTATSQTPQSKAIDDSSAIRFSNPKYLRSSPKFSPIVKSPLKQSQTPLMLTEYLGKTPITKKAAASFLDFEASPTPLSQSKPTLLSQSKIEEEEFYDVPPIDSPSKENTPIRATSHLISLLSYSPSPPVLATKLISSSHTPTSPLDAKKGVFGTKPQRVLVGVNLDNRKRRSNRSIEDFQFTEITNTVAASNVSTPSKGNELKRFKTGAVEFCPPPSHPHTANAREADQTKRKPPANKNISTDDLKRLLNEHNQRIRPRLNNNKRSLV